MLAEIASAMVLINTTIRALGDLSTDMSSYTKKEQDNQVEKEKNDKSK